MYVCIYIYIYIERERYIYIYIHTYMFVCSRRCARTWPLPCGAPWRTGDSWGARTSERDKCQHDNPCTALNSSFYDFTCSTNDRPQYKLGALLCILRRSGRRGRWLFGKGQMGWALMGVTANFMFFDRDFWGAPIKLLVSSQKCQGVPFSPIRQNAAPSVSTPLVCNQGHHHHYHHRTINKTIP